MVNGTPTQVRPQLAIPVDDMFVAALDDIRGRLLRDGMVMPSREVVVEALARMLLANKGSREQITSTVAAYLTEKHGLRHAG